MSISKDVRSFWVRTDRSSRQPQLRQYSTLQRGAIVAFFVLELLAVTFFQKFAIPINIQLYNFSIVLGNVELAIPISCISLIVLFAIIPPKIDIIRLYLFVIFLLCTLLSVVLVRNTYSPASVLLVLIINAPFIFVLEIDSKTYRELLELFLKLMLVVGGLVLLQHIMQLLWTWRSWPNLDKIVPQEFLFSGYVYDQPIRYGSHFMKPNAFFFLEVSYVSQWTAVAFAVELIFFKRLLRLIFYGIILVISFAGTGIFLLLICSPVLISRLSWRTAVGVAVAFAVSVGIASEVKWYEQVNGRFGEYARANSSSNHRFIEPLQMLVEALNRPDSLITGQGPGNIPKGPQQLWWASTKLTYEYGVLTTMSFISFFAYMLFKGAPSKRLALVLFVMFNIMGGFNIPVYPYFMFILGGLFRIRDEKRIRGARRLDSKIVAKPGDLLKWRGGAQGWGAGEITND
jgi:hypothetical protein